MKTVQETWDLLDGLCKPLPPERVALESASGRVLRENVVADTDQPPFSRSAMDGWLVRADETTSELRCDGEVLPGMLAKMPASGCAIRVLTGSAVPEQTFVVMQEDVIRENGVIKFKMKPGSEYIRFQASHARQGDVLVAAGEPIQPGRMALLATVGVAFPMVSPSIRVAHIATGSEIVGYEKKPGAGQIRDSNSPMIYSLLQEAGGERVFHCRIGESPQALQSTIDDALKTNPHILLVSGGASVGDQDHTKSVLLAAGFNLLIDRVKSRPGKPLIVAQKDNTLVFGLPGNPLAHFVCFHLFVRRVIARLRGELPTGLSLVKVADADTIKSNPRESWLPCRLSCDNSVLMAHTLPWQDSSDVTALAQVQGLLRVPSLGLAENAIAEVLPTGNYLL